jgi:hypothetical protein
MIVEGLMHHHKLGSLGMVSQLLNKRSPNPFTNSLFNHHEKEHTTELSGCSMFVHPHSRHGVLQSIGTRFMMIQIPHNMLALGWKETIKTC